MSVLKQKMFDEALLPMSFYNWFLPRRIRKLQEVEINEAYYTYKRPPARVAFN